MWNVIARIGRLNPCLMYLSPEACSEVERPNHPAVTKHSGRVGNETPRGCDLRHVDRKKPVAETQRLPTTGGHVIEMRCRVLLGRESRKQVDEHFRKRAENSPIVVILEERGSVIVYAPRRVEERRCGSLVLEREVGPEPTPSQ